MEITPKEKAEQIFISFLGADIFIDKISAKACALIAVNEIIELRKGYFDCSKEIQDEKYWQEVKEELLKM